VPVQDQAGDLDGPIVVADGERVECELLPGKKQPLGIVHRLSERPLGQTGLARPRECQPVPVVHLRVLAPLGHELTKRLDGSCEVSGGLPLSNLFEGIRRGASDESADEKGAHHEAGSEDGE
jgi:hypothetical protein